MVKKPVEEDNCSTDFCPPVNALSKEGIYYILLILAIAAFLFFIAFVINGYSFDFTFKLLLSALSF